MSSRLPEHELSFAELVWAHEPLSSGDLVKLCEQTLGWKKSTTYTVLKKLCDKKLLVNRDSVVSSLVLKDEYRARESQRFVDDVFNGSLPRFVATFFQGRSLGDDQIAELQRLIDEHRE